MKTYGEHPGEAGVKRDGSDRKLHKEEAHIYAGNKTIYATIELERNTDVFSGCTYKLRFAFGKTSFWLYDTSVDAIRAFTRNLNEFVQTECDIMERKEIDIRKRNVDDTAKQYESGLKTLQTKTKKKTLTKTN